jgi:putative ABC transport system permease protein
VTLWQTLRVALLALARNMLRSLLTTLGIIIGVGAVIAMVAIGEGAKARVEQAFASMGSNLLVLMPGTTTAGGVHGGFGSMPTLTWDDSKAIQAEIPSVRYVSAQLRATVPVISDDQNWTTSVSGVSPEYFDIRSWPVSKGSRFSQGDVDAGAKVVVLGATVADKLYGPNADPIGAVVRIKNIPFTIVGIADKKGQSATGQDYDDAAFVPVTTFGTKIQGGLKNYIAGTVYIGSTSADGTARAERQIAALLRDRHHIPPGGDDDFSIRNLTEMASAQQEGTNTFTSLLFWVAVISLVIGGIGIMNIMLVSVTERTREIGLRMAVGAKPKHLLVQFLVEALTLSMLGGLLGVGFGLIGALWVSTALKWPMLIRPDIILVAVGFSALVGIVFGLYPAYKASRLDPIDALRHE